MLTVNSYMSSISGVLLRDRCVEDAELLYYSIYRVMLKDPAANVSFRQVPTWGDEQVRRAEFEN